MPAKLVETFDAAGTSFVSVTQSFNTTTSMGRLTLNMLLSFAQFEREVTAERIRDKIAASKARGMWMGGTPPLGYAPNDRSLRIVEDHAALIRHLFARYLALGSVRQVEEELVRGGLSVPTRTLTSGKPIGGGAFTRGQLYHILRNVTYTGRIGHKGAIYPGLHPAIIDEDTFAATQTLLADHRQGHRIRATAAEASLLAGLAYDSGGEPLIATHACKGKVRHRYYVSRSLHHGTSGEGLRIPARELESLVTARLADFLADPLALAAAMSVDVTPHLLSTLPARCKALLGLLNGRRPALATMIITRIKVAEERVAVTCDLDALAAELGVERSLGAPASSVLTCVARLTRSGRALRLVQDNGAMPRATPDRSLVRLIVQARRWWTVLRSGEISAGELAAHEGVTASYVTRVVRLAFLAPAVTEAILAGRQRAGVTVASLTAEDGIAADWRAQRATLLPG